MPDSIPNWLRPADPTGNFLPARQMAVHTLATIAEINQKQQALDEAARRADMQLQIERDRTHAAQLQHDQQLQVSKAYHDAQIGMQKAKLDEASQVHQARMKQWTDTAAAQQQYSQRVAAGEDAAKVALELGPGLGISEGGMASLYKSAQPQPQAKIPDIFNDPKTGASFWINPKTGEPHQVVTHAPTADKMDRFTSKALDSAYEDIKEEQKLLRDPSTTGKAREAAQERMQGAARKIRGIQLSTGTGSNYEPPQDTPTASAPSGSKFRYDASGNLLGADGKPVAPASPSAAATGIPSGLQTNINLAKGAAGAAIPDVIKAGRLAMIAKANAPQAILRGVQYMLGDESGKSPRELLKKIVGDPGDWSDQEKKEAADIAGQIQGGSDYSD